MLKIATFVFLVLLTSHIITTDVFAQQISTTTNSPLNYTIPHLSLIKPSTISVATDKQTYSSGNEITISGTVMGQKSGISISLQFIDPNKTVQLTKTVTPNSDGIYSTSEIASLPNGTWTIKATYNGASALTSYSVNTQLNGTLPYIQKSDSATKIIPINVNPVIKTPSSGSTVTNPVTISGTAPAGSIVYLSENKSLIDHVSTDSYGHWSFSETLDTGSNIISVYDISNDQKSSIITSSFSVQPIVLSSRNLPTVNNSPFSETVPITNNAAHMTLPSGTKVAIKFLSSQSGTVTFEKTNIGSNKTYDGKLIEFIDDVTDIQPNGATCVNGCIVSYEFSQNRIPSNIGISDIRIFHDKNNDNDFNDIGETLDTQVTQESTGLYNASAKDFFNSKFAVGGMIIITSFANLAMAGGQQSSADQNQAPSQDNSNVESSHALYSKSQSSGTVPEIQSFTTPSDVVSSFLSNKFQITNTNIDTTLENYVSIQSVPDKYASQNLGIQDQYVTTVAYQDRYGRDDSNNNLNVFLQLSHTSNKINSMRGVELGGDQILADVTNSNSKKTLTNSAEIPIPQGRAENIPQKIRDTLNSSIEPSSVPQPVLNFLNNNIDLINEATGDHLTHYILLQTVPDLYAKKNLGIQDQYVTTLAFEDRYGRADSNDNLNVFLQLSHTDSQINSIRGVQLGGDDIEAFVNGVDEGSITKTIEIPINSHN